MSAVEDDSTTLAAQLGFRSGQYVQMLGSDQDDDQEDLRKGIEKITGSEVAEDDSGSTPDVVVQWFTDSDGDLTDTLTSITHHLAEDGHIWLLTPQDGRDGHLKPQAIQDAAESASLSQGKKVSAGEWTATLLVAPRTRRS